MQVQLHALLRRGFGTSVPFIFKISAAIASEHYQISTHISDHNRMSRESRKDPLGCEVRLEFD